MHLGLRSRWGEELVSPQDFRGCRSHATRVIVLAPPLGTLHVLQITPAATSRIFSLAHHLSLNQLIRLTSHSHPSSLFIFVRDRVHR